MAELLQKYSPKNLHLLVVDDDERSRAVMVKWLEEAEYTGACLLFVVEFGIYFRRYSVTPCMSGSEAADVLTCAGEDQERVEDIDLVLCDANMVTEDDKKVTLTL